METTIKTILEDASVTINGMGERAGNAALAEVVMALEQLEDMRMGIDTKLLRKLSVAVAKAANRVISPDKPIVGELAFAHESGVHVDGVLKDPVNYEPFSPEIVGAKRWIAGSEILGRFRPCS
jgi:isopropylmalate/homocitrate/citramalate synthase